MARLVSRDLVFLFLAPTSDGETADRADWPEGVGPLRTAGARERAIAARPTQPQCHRRILRRHHEAQVKRRCRRCRRWWQRWRSGCGQRSRPWWAAGSSWSWRRLSRSVHFERDGCLGRTRALVRFYLRCRSAILAVSHDGGGEMEGCFAPRPPFPGLAADYCFAAPVLLPSLARRCLYCMELTLRAACAAWSSRLPMGHVTGLRLH